MVALVLLILTLSTREGLRNGTPKNMGVDPEEMYTRLTVNKSTNGKPNLYQKKFEGYAKSDILLDMMYFNNATQLLFELGYNKP